MIMYIGIGSNMGNRRRNIENALALLSEKSTLQKCSSLYETEPVGIVDQNWFLNCVAEIETSLTSMELVDFLQSIEKKMKRIRTVQNGPRIIDLDILFFGNERVYDERLTVPHPRLHERLFVLEPLTEINPQFMHPVLGKSIAELTHDLRKKIPEYKIKKLGKA